MKKFIFTLQKPYELKLASRDQLLSQRDRLKKQLTSLREKRETTLRSMREQGERMGAQCAAGALASQISFYGGFIAGALSDIKKQDRQIAKLLMQMEDNTGKLMRIINEIKVIEKIRGEQMEEYNKELQKNDDKMLEDFFMRQDLATDFGEGLPEKTANGKKRIPKGAAKEKEAAAKKSGGKGAVAVVLAVLAALLGICYYFNIMELKTKVVAFFISQDEQYTQAMASQQAAEELLGQLQSGIDEQQEEIERRRKQLDEREAALAYKEGQAADAQTAAQVKQANLEKMANIYGGMESAAAAAILGNITDKQWVADLLAQMSEKKAAAILTAMDGKLAAEITMKMAPK